MSNIYFIRSRNKWTTFCIWDRLYEQCKLIFFIWIFFFGCYANSIKIEFNEMNANEQRWGKKRNSQIMAETWIEMIFFLVLDISNIDEFGRFEFIISAFDPGWIERVSVDFSNIAYRRTQIKCTSGRQPFFFFWQASDSGRGKRVQFINGVIILICISQIYHRIWWSTR